LNLDQVAQSMGLKDYKAMDVAHKCSIYFETKTTSAKCFICGERLFKGDKVIRFATNCWWNHVTSRRSHIVCWLSCIDTFPSSKEIGLSKKVKILRSI